MNRVSKILNKTSDLLKNISALGLICMMLLTFFDVVGRKFGHPIFGSLEIVSFLAVITVATALPYTHKLDGHIGVEILVRLLPDTVQIMISIITQLLALVFFSLASWQMFLYAVHTQNSGELSMNLGFPVYILIYVLGIGLCIFSLTILESIIRNFIKLLGGNNDS